MATAQLDLFRNAGPCASPGDREPPGLIVGPEFIDAEEEALLIAHIDGEDLQRFKFHQWEGKRLTASFGWSYDFTSGIARAAAPMPEWLLPVRARAATFAKLDPDDLVQALLIRYDPGAGIGWHKDRPMFEDVIGISLGNPATMRFRRRETTGFVRCSAELAPRSIYRLTGEVRHRWEHSIAPMNVSRWSITFRSLSAK